MSKCPLVRWDIFCKVVDNYGDIGVCWRLARQLAHERGLTIRLWVDDLNSFQRLVPAIKTNQTIQHCHQLEIRHWLPDFQDINPLAVADVVVEAFGCALPEAYVNAMSLSADHQRSAPVWINLEYLSAEPWVESHHALASPHPQLSLTKYFFFPGFTPRTGGLIAESGLMQRRKTFQTDAKAQAAFWNRLGLSSPQPDELRISMFAYGRPETEQLFLQLLEFWSTDHRPRTLLIPESILNNAISRFFKQPILIGQPVKQGNVMVLFFPFLDQDEYDRLLWACDLNFVRGEDSFVRAQWAGRPMVWQIYPQEEGIHLGKLQAFMDIYTRHFPPDAVHALTNFWALWNRDDSSAENDLPKTWLEFERCFPALNQHANDWASQINAGGDLVSRLIAFAESV